MSNWIVKSALVLTSAGTFSSPWSKPKGAEESPRCQWSRWGGATSLSTIIASVTYRGDGCAAPRYVSYKTAITAAEGRFSLVGLKLKERLSWEEWVNLEICGAYSHSLGASAGDAARGFEGNNALPASLGLWDADSRLFSLVALDKAQSVYIEPAVGFALIAANLKVAYDNMPTKNWEQLLFYGPTAGLYMRLCLSPKVNLRVGGSYMASRLRIKKYFSGIDGYYPAGAAAGRHAYRAKRGGLGALVELKYFWNSWVHLRTGVDYQSWSAGGKPASYGGPYPGYLVERTATTPMLSRLRFSWGADFTY